MLAVVTVVNLDPVEVDSVVNTRPRLRFRIEANVGEIADALGKARVVELEVAAGVAPHRAEDRVHRGVPVRRHGKPGSEREHAEMAEALAVGGDLDAADAEQVGAKIERLEGDE